MTNSRRRRLVPVAVIAASALALAACSSSTAPATTPAGGSQVLQTTVTPATAVATSATSTAVTTSVETPPAPTVVIESTPAAPVPTVSERPADTTAAATTTVDTRPVDEASRQLATAITLQAADFPEPWTVHTEGGPVSVTPSLCSYRPEGAVTLLTNGAAQRGPTMQIGTFPGYVSSIGFAFPDESTAQEYVGVLNTDAWAECNRKDLEAKQTAAGFPDVTVAIGDRTYDGLGQRGSEGYLQLPFSRGGEVIYQVAFYTYRLGRVVAVVTLESGALDDATTKAYTDGEFAALSSAYGRVDALASK